MSWGFLKAVAKVASGGIHLLVKVPGLSTVALIVPGGSAAIAAAGAADHMLRAVNSKDPKAKAAGVKAVAATRALAARGNVGAANGLTVLGKRAAALRIAKEYRVNPKTGFVRHAGASAPVGKGP